MARPRGRPPSGKYAMSGAERQRRYLDRLLSRTDTKTDVLKDENRKLKQRIATLEQELAQQRRSDDSTEIARLKRELTESQIGALVTRRELAKAERELARLTKPKAEKLPLPPDEERERVIKGLKTRVRNLTAELQHMREHAQQRQEKTGAMSFTTMSAVLKCIHPDQRGNATEADKDKACRLLTEWKADNAKARRSN